MQAQKDQQLMSRVCKYYEQCEIYQLVLERKRVEHHNESRRKQSLFLTLQSQKNTTRYKHILRTASRLNDRIPFT